MSHSPRAIALCALLLSCADGSPAGQAPAEPAPVLEDGNWGGAPAGSAAAPVSRGAVASMKERAREGNSFDEEVAADMPMPKDDATVEKGEGGGKEGAARSWFPETFLFEPLVVTDAEGTASVPVKVPDRLTNWRVLGLAHSQTGGLGGDVVSFLGTLPVYVDPVTPLFLVAGDRVRLPVQVVNTSDETVTAPLRVEGSGAVAASASGTVSVAARSSHTAWIELSATGTGQANLRASVGSADKVERTFSVRPSGRLLEQSRGGTLASPRQVELTGADDLDPGSARVRLLVFPGALAVLRGELAHASAREGAAETAYAQLLAGRGHALLEALGAPIAGTPAGAMPEKGSPAALLRDLAIVSGQRAIRLARAPDTATATVLAEAALSNPDNPVVRRMGERLVETLASSQRPDGTFGGESGGWTLQRLLVSTADGVRAVQASAAVQAGTPAEQSARRRTARAVQLKASGAFERYQHQVPDAYTAAAILASGGVSGEVAADLRNRVRQAVQEDDDGARYLPVEEGIVRADGRVPSRAEATAMAVLALQGDPEATWLPDLGAWLLGSYRPGNGWGDGRANLACLQAVLKVFSEPLPEAVTVTLSMDGREVTRGQLDKAALQQIVSLDAPARGARGTHSWSVQAEPALPGLGFALTLQTWVPWEESAARGLELAVEAPDSPRVGQPTEMTLQAAAPAGLALEIHQDLPAGVQVDEDSLAALVSAGILSSYEAAEGMVRLDVPALDPGETFVATYTVVPTLAGTLHSGASSVAPADRDDLTFFVPPMVWTVRP